MRGTDLKANEGTEEGDQRGSGGQGKFAEEV